MRSAPRWMAPGAPADCEIELPGFAPPLVPAEASAQPVATQMSYDPNTGRFTAVLSVTGDGMEPVNIRLSGACLETIEVPVAAGRLQAGDRSRRVGRAHGSRARCSALRTEVARIPPQAIGMALRHPCLPASRCRLRISVRPPLVQKGRGRADPTGQPGPHAERPGPGSGPRRGSASTSAC